MKFNIKIFFACLFVCVLTVSCTDILGGGSRVDRYRQQQEVANNESDVPFIPEEEPTDPSNPGGGTDEPEEPLPEGAAAYSMFDVLKANGQIDEEILAHFPSDVQANVRSQLASISGSFTSADLQRKVIEIQEIRDDTPKARLISSQTWSDGSDSKYLSSLSSDKFTKKYGSFTVYTVMNVNVSPTYYMYNGYNPFFGATGSTNAGTYGDGSERRMDRFVFYRFTGNASGQDLDNMLVALDTHTRLLFSFGVPTGFKEVFGKSNPTSWGSVESNVKVDGKSYKFYEYDPAGYVDASGNFVMADWYMEKNAKGDYTPVYTGKSPYLHTVIVGGASATEYLDALKGRELYYEDADELYTVSSEGSTIEASGSIKQTYTFEGATSSTKGTFSGATFTINEDGTVLMSENGVDKLLKAPVVNTIKISAKSIKNIKMVGRVYSWFKWRDTTDEVYVTYQIQSTVYQGDAGTYDILSHRYNGMRRPNGDFMSGVSETFRGIENFTDKITKGSTLNPVSEKTDKTYEVSNAQFTSTNIALDSLIVAQGESFAGFLESATDQTRTYNDYGKPNVVLKYDVAQKGFVLDAAKSSLANTTVTSNFVLRQGETKDLAVTYNNQSVVTYTLSF